MSEHSAIPLPVSIESPSAMLSPKENNKLQADDSNDDFINLLNNAVATADNKSKESESSDHKPELSPSESDLIPMISVNPNPEQQLVSNFNTGASSEKSPNTFGQQNRGIFSPFKVTDNLSSNASLDSTVTNLISSSDNSKPSGEITIISDTSNGRGASTLPYIANSPPDQSNAPPGFEAQSAMAGPRGKDQPTASTHDNTGSNRLTEEASSTETRRVVSDSNSNPINVLSRSDEWKNGIWRRPINEIIKEKVDQQRTQEQLNQTDNLRENSELRDMQKARSSNVPNEQPRDFTTNRPANHEHVVRNPTNISNSESQTVGGVKPQSENQSPGLNVKSVTIEKGGNETSSVRPTESNTNQTQPNQSQASQAQPNQASNSGSSSANPLDSGVNQSKQQTPMDNRMINLSNGQINIDTSSVTHGAEASTISNTGAHQSTTQTITIKEPISVLGDAPNRIASEIAKSGVESLPDNTRSILKVELKPPRLGPMEIEIHKTESGMEIKLGVKTIFARELLVQRGDEIRNALLEQGIDIKKFELVNLNQNRQESNPQQTGFGFNQGTSNQGGDESGSHLSNLVSGETGDDESLSTGDAQDISAQKESYANSGHLNVLA